MGGLFNSVPPNFWIVSFTMFTDTSKHWICLEDMELKRMC